MPRTNTMMRRFLHVTLLASFSNLIAQEAPRPERLIKLEQSYSTAVERAIAPLTKTYLAELEKLKTDLTRQGDLNGALAVQSALNKAAHSKLVVGSSAPDDSTSTAAAPATAAKVTKKNPFIGYWIGLDSSGKKMGLVINEDGSSVNMKFNDSEKRVRNAGHLNNYKWTRDGNTLTNVNPDGKSQVWTMNADGTSTVVWNGGPPGVFKKGSEKDLLP
jgi:hypothetical protein